MNEFLTDLKMDELFLPSVSTASKKPGTPLIISDIRKGSTAHRSVPVTHRNFTRTVYLNA